MKTLSLIWHDNVAEVKLNRPNQSNALNLDCFHEIIEIGEKLSSCDRVRSVVLTLSLIHI